MKEQLGEKGYLFDRLENVKSFRQERSTKRSMKRAVTDGRSREGEANFETRCRNQNKLVGYMRRKITGKGLEQLSDDGKVEVQSTGRVNCN